MTFIEFGQFLMCSSAVLFCLTSVFSWLCAGMCACLHINPLCLTYLSSVFYDSVDIVKPYWH